MPKIFIVALDVKTNLSKPIMLCMQRNKKVFRHGRFPERLVVPRDQALSLSPPVLVRMSVKSIKYTLSLSFPDFY